ncbi:uncharacterized protein N7459_000884 [Penicillium hispanicum]|uniref:uncharacterized protein n=1 Tax=Penicillium hispanicum TaxID=1080232 RepID=UPI00254046CB|nr:uncharacterized protein N7459_000884 [Penicillium hispanicum]KAJ5594676.1 hypothetical protein N7459_000884 [Penicillium hispanicum]
MSSIQPSKKPRVRKPAPPRKKACLSCTDAKVRCGLEKPSCLRCRSRSIQCRYSGSDEIRSTATSYSGIASPEATNSYRPSSGIPTTPTAPSTSLVSLDSADHHVYPSDTSSTGNPPEDPGLDFSHLDLVPMVDAEDIRDRWLRPYIVTARGQVPKLLDSFTVQFLTCVLRSYPGHLLNGTDVPPFIHPLQLTLKPVPRALANSVSLVRMWINHIAGSEAMVLATVKQEMERISQEEYSPIQIQHHPTTPFETLCAFQAYLLYVLMAYYHPLETTTLVDDSLIVALQDLAFRTAKTGLTTPAETAHTRPHWESWIAASAKRRTLLTMYLFTSVYNAARGLPNFVADELKDVLVPESKALWAARSRTAWERAYTRHLSRWPDGMLQISELWRSPATGSEARRERIVRWVEEADEFGMMLFAVCAHIHGC